MHSAQNTHSTQDVHDTHNTLNPISINTFSPDTQTTKINTTIQNTATRKRINIVAAMERMTTRISTVVVEKRMTNTVEMRTITTTSLTTSYL
jgi:hypothetical protein